MKALPMLPGTRLQGHLPMVAIIASTVVVVVISIFSLNQGWFSIFQNLFYFPIILACVFYPRRGLVFSVILAWVYFGIILAFTEDPATLQGALIRVIFFILIAAVISYLSLIRVRTEGVLREQEAMYRNFMDKAPEMILIHKHGVIRYVNPVVADTLHIQPEDAVNRPITDFVAPEYHARIKETVQRRLQGDDIAPYDIELVGKDGERRAVLVSGNRITFEGEPALIVILTDITERKRVEEALKFSNLLLSTEHEATIDGILIVNSGGKILFSNRRFKEIWGIPEDVIASGSDELALQSVTETLAQPEEFMARVRYLYEHPAESSQEEVQLRDGRVLDRYSTPLTGADGTYLGRVWFFRDISGRKRVEGALYQANRKLNLLSSITRHDINNQLTVLKGYLDLSEDFIGDPARLGEIIRKEKQAAESIERQIAFTKEYQEMGVEAPLWQSVAPAIDRATRALPVQDVKVDVGFTDLDVYADPLFEKVFYNLIDNALKYGGEGLKRIHITSKETAAGLVIVCEDDGVGIAWEDKTRLFTKGFGKHTGLGLFLTREILGITGITITENGEPGKGARFELNVPKGIYRFTPGST